MVLIPKNETHFPNFEQNGSIVGFSWLVFFFAFVKASSVEKEAFVLHEVLFFTKFINLAMTIRF